jgi:hypothetical protein
MKHGSKNIRLISDIICIKYLTTFHFLKESCFWNILNKCDYIRLFFENNHYDYERFGVKENNQRIIWI